MNLTRNVRRLAAFGGALAALLIATPASFGQAVLGQPSYGSCASCAPCEQGCNFWHCPPPYKHCQEGGPRICVMCGCPKPVCCPSDAPNWGYFPTCWRPTQWGPNWSHCYGTPPASQIVPPLNQNATPSVPQMPGADLPNQLPQPRPLSPNQPLLSRPGLQ